MVLVPAHNMEEEEEITLNDVFLHVHTENHDEKTLIDGRSACLHDRDLPVVTCHITQASGVDTECEAIIESHLGVHIDSRVSTSRAPPPPKKQHQQTRMDLTDLLVQQHHDGDDQDIIEWMDEEHLGDEC
ncbi:hypothetical protein Sjap_022100 [Stephania japonica]|uniref:Uncharacterized protein n=1 Tax=Stephania japonica TaxID=461633 RepID=A0AAP0ETY3_9MAGN